MKNFLLLTGIVFCSLTALAEQHFLCEIKPYIFENNGPYRDYLLITLDSKNQLVRVRATATAKDDDKIVVPSESLIQYNYGVKNPAPAIKPEEADSSGIKGPLRGYALNSKVYISLPTNFVSEESEGLLQADEEEVTKILLCRLIDRSDRDFKLFY